MSKVFISYSSKDSDFARHIATDIQANGHDVWMDEWNIRVGDCISSSIEQAISDCDFVILVLSPHSVASGWVDKEWRAKHWEEVELRQVRVLPVLLADCDIPVLLRSKRYADFRQNYSVGFTALIVSLSPLIPSLSSPTTAPLPRNENAGEITELLSRLHSRTVPVSQCLAEALSLAIRMGQDGLRIFCHHELVGYPVEELSESRSAAYINDPDDTAPRHRLIESFVSIYRINHRGGFFHSTSEALAYMRSRPDDFSPVKTFIPIPISQIESKRQSDPGSSIGIAETTLGEFLGDTTHPNATVFIHQDPAAYSAMVESVREELSRLLISLLPTGGMPPAAPAD